MSDQIRTWLAMGLLAASLVVAMNEKPVPTPDDSGLVLRGLFVGPSAAADGAVISAMAAEIADEIEWDGTQAEPKLKSGVQFDTLRVRAREFRVRGDRIGDRQPRVRDAIHAYLDQAVGTSGGPVDAEQRKRWVNAYRDIARAAANATR